MTLILVLGNVKLGWLRARSIGAEISTFKDDILKYDLNIEQSLQASALLRAVKAVFILTLYHCWCSGSVSLLLGEWREMILVSDPQ